MKSNRLHILTEASLCIALSLIFSVLVLFRMPQGGSITLEMVPLIFLAYRHGMRWGMTAGALSGVLQFFMGGFGVSIFQILLDYPIAFGSLGLAGVFKNHKIISGCIGGFARLFCHVLAGVIFFSDYVPTGQNPWIYSSLYNATFMIPSLILSLILALILWKKISAIRT